MGPYGTTSVDTPSLTRQTAGDRAETQEASAIGTWCLNLSPHPTPGTSGSAMNSLWGQRWKGTETHRWHSCPLEKRGPRRPPPPGEAGFGCQARDLSGCCLSLVLWAWYRTKRDGSVNKSAGLGASPTFKSCISPLTRPKFTVSQFRRLQGQGQGASRGISF